MPTFRRTTPSRSEALIEIHERRDELRGVAIAEEPEFLRHFTRRFAML